MLRVSWSVSGAEDSIEEGPQTVFLIMTTKAFDCERMKVMLFVL